MDPITTSALAAALLKVLDGASEEAGRNLWERFSRSVQHAFGRRSPESEAAGELARAADQVRAEELAERVVDASTEDAELLAELREWLADVREASSGDTVNTIGPNAQITGDVVQARDIRGDIRFGR